MCLAARGVQVGVTVGSSNFGVTWVHSRVSPAVSQHLHPRTHTRTRTRAHTHTHTHSHTHTCINSIPHPHPRNSPSRWSHTSPAPGINVGYPDVDAPKASCTTSPVCLSGGAYQPGCSCKVLSSSSFLTPPTCNLSHASLTGVHPYLHPHHPCLSHLWPPTFPPVCFGLLGSHMQPMPQGASPIDCVVSPADSVSSVGSW